MPAVPEQGAVTLYSEASKNRREGRGKKGGGKGGRKEISRYMHAKVIASKCFMDNAWISKFFRQVY